MAARGALRADEIADRGTIVIAMLAVCSDIEPSLLTCVNRLPGCAAARGAPGPRSGDRWCCGYVGLGRQPRACRLIGRLKQSRAGRQMAPAELDRRRFQVVRVKIEGVGDSANRGPGIAFVQAGRDRPQLFGARPASRPTSFSAQKEYGG
jgi:hypothetical protein